MSDDEKYLLGQVKERTEQILVRLDRIEETLERHSTWISEQAGAGRIRSAVAAKVWQIVLLMLGPVAGGMIGAWFARKGVKVK